MPVAEQFKTPWREWLTWLSTAAVAALLWNVVTGTTAQAKKRRHRPGRHHQHRRQRKHDGLQRYEPHEIKRTARTKTCPPEMVDVAGRFCIDRWENMSVDRRTGQALSPFYPPEPRLAHMMYRRWSERFQQELQQAHSLALEAGVADPWWMMDASPSDDWNADAAAFWSKPPPDGGADGARPLVSGPDAPWGWVLLGKPDASDRRPRPVMQIPALPPWEQGTFEPVAVSKAHVIPQGYTPGFVAGRACRAAGKRLCTESEWVTACKGQKGTKFPYGEHYRQGVCNVFRPSHPAMVLHGSFSIGLSDPRLNLVRVHGDDLLRKTGETPRCRSQWGNDYIYDMVGNLDEWVDDPSGVFVGGFYARNTRNGCEARVSNHPRVYFDYSLGFRCCKDLVGGDGDEHHRASSR